MGTIYEMGLIADIHKDLENGALQLIVEYHERLHVLAAEMCGDEAQAEDLVFRTFERVLTKAKTYKSDTNLFGWMKSIMENIHKDDLKRPVARNTTAVEAEELEQIAGADWSTDEQVIRNSDSEALRAALRDLPPEYRQTVILRFYEDLSLKEIASFLNKPVGTIGRRIHVALHLLSGKLSAEFDKAKKPLAVLLAALLGIGSLFGAWKAAETIWPEAFSSAPEAEQIAAADPLPQPEETLAADALPTVVPEDDEPAAADTAGEAAQAEPPPATDLKEEQVTQEQVNTKKAEGEETMGAKKLMMAAVAAVVGNVLAGNTLNVPAEYATIESAVAVAVKGDEIVLAASEAPYVLAANLTVPSGVTLRGETGNRDDVVVKPGGYAVYLSNANAVLADLTVSDASASGDTPKMGVVQVSHASAVCVNCRVTNCNIANSNGRGAIRVTAGVVTNCLVDANYTKTGRAYSVGIRQEGGTVANTVIRDNYYDGFNSGYADGALRGGALFISGGMAVNCHIANNRFGAFTDDTRLAEGRHFATGVQLQGSAQLINCTIVGNTYAADDTGRVLGVSLDSANARVRNCVILDNGNTSGAIRNIDPSSAFEYCAVAEAEMEGCTSPTSATLAGDFALSDGFYRPLKGGAACDTGDQSLLPAAYTTDILGAARISGLRIDIGAVELDQSALMCHFTAESYGGPLPFSTTLTGVADGGTGPFTYAWDLDGDGVFERSGADLTSVLLDINVASTSNVTLKVTDSKSKTATFSQAFTVYQKYFHVDPTSANPKAPYATKETAAHTVAEALAVATPNSTVSLAKGDYVLTAVLTIPANVTVRGDTGDRADVVLSGRQIQLYNADSVLADLTVANTTCSGETLKYGVIRMTHATACITNCRVTACTMADYNSRAPILMTAGRLSGCLVDANRATATSPYAMAVRQEGGTVENTVIRDNACQNGFSSSALFGAALNMTGGKAVNCYIANNSLGGFTDNSSIPAGSAYASGVALQGSAQLVNCTVVGNTYTADDTGRVLGVTVYNTANAKVQNCVILDNGNTAGAIRNISPSTFFDHCAVAAGETAGCTASVAAALGSDFVLANGVYRPLRGCAACDAGDKTLLPTGYATDLMDNVRISGTEIDIGAVELDQDALLCYFTAGAEGGPIPFSTTLTAVVEGGTSPFSYAWDLDGDGVFERSGADLTNIRLDINATGVSNITLRVTDAASATNVFGKAFTVYQGVFYVDAQSENPVPPYATKATAAKSLADALSVVMPNATVSLAKGTHLLTSHVTVPASVTVRGETGDRNDVMILPGSSQIALANANSELADLTLTNANCVGEVVKYGMLRMTHATARVTNCRITGCVLSDTNARGLIYQSAGTVSGCLIDANYATTTHPQAMAILMDGGTVENSIIRGNSCRNGLNSGSLHGAALNLSAGARVVNCLIEGNSLGDFTDGSLAPAGSAYASGVALQGSAQLVNCLVVGNTYTAEDTGRVVGVAVYNTASAMAINCAILDNASTVGSVRNILPSENFDHCAVAPDESAGCTESIPTTFEASYRRDRKTGLLKHRPGSLLIDAGKPQPSLETGVDLVLRPRLHGKAIDIGPFECPGIPGFGIFIR